jgi:hypothetical protein
MRENQGSSLSAFYRSLQLEISRLGVLARVPASAVIAGVVCLLLKGMEIRDYFDQPAPPLHQEQHVTVYVPSLPSENIPYLRTEIEQEQSGNTQPQSREEGRAQISRSTVHSEQPGSAFPKRERAPHESDSQMASNSGAGTAVSPVVSPTVVGLWQSNMNVNYDISQPDSGSFAWTATPGRIPVEVASGAISGRVVGATWVGAGGIGNAVGTITKVRNGRAVEIKWSNGVRFHRT